LKRATHNPSGGQKQGLQVVQKVKTARQAQRVEHEFKRQLGAVMTESRANAFSWSRTACTASALRWAWVGCAM